MGALWSSWTMTVKPLSRTNFWNGMSISFSCANAPAAKNAARKTKTIVLIRIVPPNEHRFAVRVSMSNQTHTIKKNERKHQAPLHPVLFNPACPGDGRDRQRFGSL